MVIALQCPGQGSQFVGMGQDLAREFPAARETFSEADDILGTSLSRLCWEGPDTELTLTINAQPAILVHSVAVWRILQAERPLEVRVAAGHSLGEFSAYVASGSLGFAEALRTVRRRGELMYETGTQRAGTMTAVIGLDDAAAEEACRRASAETGEIVVPANYNSPGQLVLSGDVSAVRRAEELVSEAGARRVIQLNVSGAFHSPLMAPAASGLLEALETAGQSDPVFPIVSNVTAEAVDRADVAQELLVRQLTSPVRWAQGVQTMLAMGATRMVEIGPGNVLTGLLKRIDRTATGEALSTAEQVSEFLRKGA